MYVQEKCIDVMCNTKMHNISKSVKFDDADHVKAEVILGQGQNCPIEQAHTRVSFTNIHNDDSQSINKARVMLGQGHDQILEVSGMVFYNKKHTPAQIESLLVRPLSHNIKIFKANAQKVVARSYACMVKGQTKEQTNNQTYCKGGIFWPQEGVNKSP